MHRVLERLIAEQRFYEQFPQTPLRSLGFDIQYDEEPTHIDTDMQRFGDSSACPFLEERSCLHNFLRGGVFNPEDDSSALLAQAHEAFLVRRLERLDMRGTMPSTATPTMHSMSGVC